MSLGIRIKSEHKGSSITQSHYLEQVLKKFSCSDCSPISTPRDSSMKLMPNNVQVISQFKYLKALDV